MTHVLLTPFMKIFLERGSGSCQRARVILELIEGDLKRPPVVFFCAGTAKADEAIREEIQRRWGT